MVQDLPLRPAQPARVSPQRDHPDLLQRRPRPLARQPSDPSLGRDLRGRPVVLEFLWRRKHELGQSEGSGQSSPRRVILSSLIKMLTDLLGSSATHRLLTSGTLSNQVRLPSRATGLHLLRRKRGRIPIPMEAGRTPPRKQKSPLPPRRPLLRPPRPSPPWPHPTPSRHCPRKPRHPLLLQRPRPSSLARRLVARLERQPR